PVVRSQRVGDSYRTPPNGRIWNPLWHLRGSVRIPDALSTGEVLDRVERLLADQDRAISQRDASQVGFYLPAWKMRGPATQAMGLHDKGWFRIDQEPQGRRLTYDLRSLHAMIFYL